MEKTDFVPEEAAERVKIMLMMAEGVGEVMNMGFEPDAMVRDLNDLGFMVMLDESLRRVRIDT